MHYTTGTPQESKCRGRKNKSHKNMKTEMTVGVPLWLFNENGEHEKRLPCSIHVKARSEPILTSKAPIGEERKVETAGSTCV